MSTTRRVTPLLPVLLLAFAAAVGLGIPATARPAGANRASTRSSPPVIGDGPTRVLVVGDSVLEGADGEIPAALPWRDVVVDTEVSRSTGQSVDAAASHGTDWDVVVTLLGHNDGGTPRAYEPAYRRLFDTFAGSPRIVALTIHEVRPYYPTVNAFLRDEASRRSNVRILDWNAVVTAHPGTTASDGLHLSPSGADLVAHEIAAQVATAEVELAPTTTTTAAPTTTTGRPATTAPPTTAARTPTAGTTPSTTTAPATTTTEGLSLDRIEVPSDPATSSEPGPHTPRWAWPGVLAGSAALALVLGREHRRRRTEVSGEGSSELEGG